MSLIRKASAVVVDANFHPDTIRTICVTANQYGVPVWFEPTSIPKSTKIIQAGVLDLLTCIFALLVWQILFYFFNSINISPLTVASY